MFRVHSRVRVRCGNTRRPDPRYRVEFMPGSIGDARLSTAARTESCRYAQTGVLVNTNNNNVRTSRY